MTLQIFNHLLPIFFKLIKNKEKGILSNSFYEANITLTPKSDKNNAYTHTHIILKANISNEHWCKIFNKVSANTHNNKFKRLTGLSSSNAKMIQLPQFNQCDAHQQKKINFIYSFQ